MISKYFYDESLSKWEANLPLNKYGKYFKMLSDKDQLMDKGVFKYQDENTIVWTANPEQFDPSQPIPLPVEFKRVTPFVRPITIDSDPFTKGDYELHDFVIPAHNSDWGRIHFTFIPKVRRDAESLDTAVTEAAKEPKKVVVIDQSASEPVVKRNPAVSTVAQKIDTPSDNGRSSTISVSLYDSYEKAKSGIIGSPSEAIKIGAGVLAGTALLGAAYFVGQRNKDK